MVWEGGGIGEAVVEDVGEGGQRREKGRRMGGRSEKEKGWRGRGEGGKTKKGRLGKGK